MTPACGPPLFFTTDGLAKTYRLGSWNGITFSGVPRPGNNIYKLGFTFNDEGIYYIYEISNSSIFSRFVLNQNGVLQRKIWIDQSKGWVVFLNAPQDICDTYGQCGRFGSCNIANSRVCECLKKFVPSSTRDWFTGDYYSGCVRETPLNCPNDGFLKYSNVKLPDTRSSWINETATLKECETRCLRNCSCMAYTSLDVSMGTGCLLWFDELIDIRQIPNGDGQDIYIRMASSELGGSKVNANEKIIISLTVSIGMILLGVSLVVCVSRKKQKRKNQMKLIQEERLRHDAEQLQSKERQQEDLELPLVDFDTIAKATNYFSLDNKLGEGGFSPLYKVIVKGSQRQPPKKIRTESRHL